MGKILGSARLHRFWWQNPLRLQGSRAPDGSLAAPVLKAIIEGGSYKQGGFLGFGAKTIKTDALVDNGDPTFILFITDGENADKPASDAIIKKSSDMNVFIQFIGIGNEKFKYLIALDDMPGRKRDNTGFSKMKDLDKASDNELFTFFGYVFWTISHLKKFNIFIFHQVFHRLFKTKKYPV